MTIPGRLLLGMMIISILSYGFSASAFADFHGCGPDEILNVEGVCVSAFGDEPAAGAPFTVQTDRDSYTEGNTIKISGTIKTLNQNYPVDVTITIFDPNNNLVGQAIAQTSRILQIHLKYAQILVSEMCVNKMYT